MFWRLIFLIRFVFILYIFISYTYYKLHGYLVITTHFNVNILIWHSSLQSYEKSASVNGFEYKIHHGSFIDIVSAKSFIFSFPFCHCIVCPSSASVYPFGIFKLFSNLKWLISSHSALVHWDWHVENAGLMNVIIHSVKRSCSNFWHSIIPSKLVGPY